MGGIDMEYFKAARLLQYRRRHGGHAPAARDGKFPTPSGQGRVPAARRQELRRRPVPHHVRGRRRTARPSIRCRATCRRARAPETNPERAKLYPLNIISPKSHGFLELVLRQRDAQDQRPGRAVRADLARRTPPSANIREGDPVRVSTTTAAISRAWPASPTTSIPASSWRRSAIGGASTAPTAR